MRVERRGKIEPLTPRWILFLREAMGGVDLDAIQSSEVLRADFACLSGLIALEIKSLEEDGTERMDNLTDELRQRPDWPEFLGSAPVQAMTRHMDDPEAVNAKFVNRIGRAIVNHLKKANKQLGAHQDNFPRKNLVRLMLLINEDHELYEPALIAHIVQRALKRTKDGRPLYPNIDTVIFTSERHATVKNGQVVFPLIAVEGSGLETDIWKRTIVDHLFERWANWTHTPTYKGNPKDVAFTTLDHVPEKMARQDLWRLQYRRRPYMAHISDEDLRDRFDEAMATSMLTMHKHAPVKPSIAVRDQAIILFTHVMMEMSERGITAPKFAIESKRLVAAAGRLNMPPPVVTWFESMDRR